MIVKLVERKMEYSVMLICKKLEQILDSVACTITNIFLNYVVIKYCWLVITVIIIGYLNDAKI